MDFLNTAYRQLAELFLSMTPAARVTTGLLLAVIVVSFAFLFQTESESPHHVLFGTSLTRAEIAALEVAFAQDDLNSWQTEGNRILVPKSERHSYLAAASLHKALPESSSIIWDDVFKNTSPLDTRGMQEGKARQAEHRELARILREIDQIEEASVKIVEKLGKGFPRQPERTALAAVRATGNRHIDADLVKTVRYTVAVGGGVDSKNVTVLDSKTGTAYPGHGEEGPSLLEENIYRENQRAFEDHYRQKIEEHLSMIQGLRVGVLVQLDKNLQNQTSKRQYDQGVPVMSKEYKKDTATANPQVGGRVGVSANTVQGNQGQSIASAGKENTIAEERSEVERLPAATQTFTQTAPLTPTLVKASVAVPTSYFEKIWRQRNPVAPGEDPVEPDPVAVERIAEAEKTKIENIVITILPEPPPGDDPVPLVSVDTYTETPLPPIEPPGVAATTGTWLGSHWQTLGTFILALIGVVMLRSMVLSAQDAVAASAGQPAVPIENLSVAEPPDEEDGEEDVDFSNSLKARFQGSGRSLRDELTELVREDPDAAANVLENWIGDAA